MELFNLLISILVMLTAVIGAALLLITVFKLSLRLMGKSTARDSSPEREKED